MTKIYRCDFCDKEELSGTPKDSYLVHYGNSRIKIYIICKNFIECERKRYKDNNTFLTTEKYNIINEFKTKFKLDILINK